MEIEMLSNPWTVAGFIDLIIEVISSFLIETVFKLSPVLINNERSSQKVH